MKYLAFLMVFFALFLVYGCTEDSALSDIEISDPSLIQFEAELTRKWDKNGLLYTHVSVYLYDKNHNLIKLKKGSVSINNNVMQVDEIGINKAPYYTISPSVLLVESGKTYTIVVELSDGQEYYSTVTSQKFDLYEFNLPKLHKKANDLAVTWKAADIENELVLTLRCAYNFNNNTGETFDKFNPNQLERKNASMLIASSAFNKKEGTTNAYFSLSSNKQGVVDSRFRLNSKISVQFVIENECGLN